MSPDGVLTIISIGILACAFSHVGVIVMLRARRHMATRRFVDLQREERRLRHAVDERTAELTAAEAANAKRKGKVGDLGRRKATLQADRFRFRHFLGSPGGGASSFLFQVSLTGGGGRVIEGQRGVRASPEIWEKKNFVEVFAKDLDAAERVLDFAFPRTIFSRVMRRAGEEG